MQPNSLLVMWSGFNLVRKFLLISESLTQLV
jgi:hypothetical protein